MEITREQILESAKNYCRQYNVNFSSMIENHGGEDKFINEVVDIDKNATHVLNINSAGEKYVCKALWRLDCKPNYGLISWAYDKGYASYSSAEIVCRGGYAVTTSKGGTRYDVEDDIIEDVEYNI